MAKINPLNLPKDEDVTQVQVGDMTASVVKLTSENRQGMLEVVMSMYLDDVCMYCKGTFTRDELRTAIVAHKNPHGRIVHRQCWNANNEEQK